MSSFYGKAIHPRTGKVEEAAFLDNYFGHRWYGVRFPDGQVFRDEEVKSLPATHTTSTVSLEPGIRRLVPDQDEAVKASPARKEGQT